MIIVLLSSNCSSFEKMDDYLKIEKIGEGEVVFALVMHI